MHEHVMAEYLLLEYIYTLYRRYSFYRELYVIVITILRRGQITHMKSIGICWIFNFSISTMSKSCRKSNKYTRALVVEWTEPIFNAKNVLLLAAILHHTTLQYTAKKKFSPKG